MNPELDYAIATEILGYPKDGWIAYIGTQEVNGVKQKVCKLAKPAGNRAACYQEIKVFSPSSNWALAGPLLEKNGVSLEMLLLNNLPNMIT